MTTTVQPAPGSCPSELVDPGDTRAHMRAQDSTLATEAALAALARQYGVRSDSVLSVPPEGR